MPSLKTFVSRFSKFFMVLYDVYLLHLLSLETFKSIFSHEFFTVSHRVLNFLRYLVCLVSVLYHFVVNYGSHLNLLREFRFFTIRTVRGIFPNANQWEASNSSDPPVSLTATHQSASNQSAPNYNVDLLSNQLHSTQPLASSELQDDKISVSNSSQLQAPRDWAALDLDVISEIINRLPTDEDFVSFKYVCRWCQFICSGMNWTTRPQIPWLMLSENQDSEMRSFYSFDKNKHYEIELPAALRRRCFASPHGWIITFGPDGKIHLLNPLSQDHKMLPPLSASNRIRELAARDWFRFIHKLMVFKSSRNQFIVMAIYGKKKHLAFVRFGERKWNTIRNAFDFRDVALFKGQFYALRAFGTLVRIEFRDVARAIFVALSPEDSRIRSAVEAYLVKSSSGDLLGVFRNGFVLEMRRETEDFWVYKFDFETEEWVRMEELGDSALFVGEGNSWSIRATNAKHSNRIYYADDYWKRQRPGEVTLNGHDIGVFSMESGEIELLNFGMDLPYEFSRPIWYTPTLRSKFFQY